MLVLVINELFAFTTRKVEHHLLVDTSQGERDVEIRFDVVFHVLKCADLDIKVEDSKGVSYDPSHVVTHKVPMNDGVEAVTDLAAATGCRMYGVLGVKKVQRALTTKHFPLHAHAILDFRSLEIFIF